MKMLTRDLFTVINLAVTRQQALARTTRYCFAIFVCMSVYPSRCGTVSERIHILSNFLDHLEVTLSRTAVTKFQGDFLSFGIKCTRGVKNFANFDRNPRLFQKWYEIGP